MVSCFVVQFAIGAIVALLLLSYIIWPGPTGKALLAGVTLSDCRGLLLGSMTRWSIVVVGKEISKTGIGLPSNRMQRVGRERLLMGVSARLTPLDLLFGLTRFFQRWEARAT